MNLKEIETILNSGLPDKTQEYLIIQCIANDKSAIPAILDILAEERRINSELITGFGAELSRAYVFIEEKVPDSKQNRPYGFTKEFVLGEIYEFYKRWKNKINFGFKNEKFNFKD